MSREDAFTLLVVMKLDRYEPPPPLIPERMAALFMEITSKDVPDEMRFFTRRGRRAR